MSLYLFQHILAGAHAHLLGLFKMCIRDSSSTGHMILVEQVVKFNASEEFMSMFRVEMCIRDRIKTGGTR